MLGSRALLILVAVTAAAVVAAVLSRQPDQSEQSADFGAYFPALPGRVNDVGKIVIRSSGARSTLLRQDGRWTLSEKGGYPASTSKLRALILGMARLERVEPKTDDPLRYAELDLADVTEPDAGSLLVQMQDQSGADLAVLVAGKRRTAGPDEEIYVRTPGDPRVWLVRGNLPRDADPGAWLDKALLKLDADRIRGVRLRHPDGGTVHVYRQEPGQKDYILEDLPAGGEIESQYALNRVATGFQNLSVTDVKPAQEFEFNAGVAVLETFDGLRVTLRAGKQAEEVWVRLSAEFDPALVHGDAGAETDAGDVKGEVDELNRRWQAWSYLLPGYQVESILVNKADLVKQPPSE